MYVRVAASRSLIAAYQLISNGAKNINILRGGSSEWVKQGRRWTGPDGSEEVQEAEQSQ
jgi:3-mercaptopyruvate sulfurtransferase SseA